MGTDENLDLAGLENGVEVHTQEAKICCLQLQARGTALAGGERDLRNGFQLQSGARNARDTIANEQEHGLLGCVGAFVRHADRNLDRVGLRGGVCAEPQIRVREAAVRETETERKLRRVRRVEVLTREVILRVFRPTGISLPVEQRDLADGELQSGAPLALRIGAAYTTICSPMFRPICGSAANGASPPTTSASM